MFIYNESQPVYWATHSHTNTRNMKTLSQINKGLDRCCEVSHVNQTGKLNNALKTTQDPYTLPPCGWKCSSNFKHSQQNLTCFISVRVTRISLRVVLFVILHSAHTHTYKKIQMLNLWVYCLGNIWREFDLLCLIMLVNYRKGAVSSKNVYLSQRFQNCILSNNLVIVYFVYHLVWITFSVWQFLCQLWHVWKGRLLQKAESQNVPNVRMKSSSLDSFENKNDNISNGPMHSQFQCNLNTIVFCLPEYQFLSYGDFCDVYSIRLWLMSQCTENDVLSQYFEYSWNCTPIVLRSQI